MLTIGHSTLSIESFLRALRERRGGAVEDIFVLGDGRSSRKPHKMTSFAQVSDGLLFYPPPQPALFTVE